MENIKEIKDLLDQYMSQYQQIEKAIKAEFSPSRSPIDLDETIEIFDMWDDLVVKLNILAADINEETSRLQDIVEVLSDRWDVLLAEDPDADELPPVSNN